jgi:hypothetical protein
MNEFFDTIKVLLVLLYNLVLIGGTAYLVQAHDWSVWAFLLPVLFFITKKENHDQT